MKVNLSNESINSFLDRMHLSKKKIYDLKINKKINSNLDILINGSIDIDTSEDVNFKPMDGKLDIIYEDDDYLVINKPRGIIIHDDYDSLANVVSKYFIDNNIKSAIRYPSRLDRDTTGVIIFPKNMIIASYMDYLFSNDEVKKEYVALVHNRFTNLSGKINYAISTDRHNNNKMVTTKNGKKAITLYKVVKNGDISLLSVRIKTGRTHQIRLHLSKIGHPVLGDNIYGYSDGVLMLHCKMIEFLNYDGKIMKFVAKENEQFKEKMDEIGA